MNKFLLTWNIMLLITLTTLIIFKKLVLNINPSILSIVILIITLLLLIFHNKVVKLLKKM
jgi:hypothetical protein